MKTKFHWPVSPPLGRIAANEVHLWCISVESLGGFVDHLFSLLSVEEQQRARRFHFERDRLRSITARAVLRTIVGSYLNVDPRCLRFSYGKNGKPELAGACELKFNLSHADDVVIFAIAKDRDLGVDVEKVRSFPEIEDVAKRFFLPEEIDGLTRLSGAEKIDEFYRCWTRGEALLKWSGEGITEPEGRRRIANRFNGMTHDVKPSSDYVGAVTLEGGPVKVSMWQWSQGTGIPCGCA